jgi:hypothetical protein
LLISEQKKITTPQIITEALPYKQRYKTFYPKITRFLSKTALNKAGKPLLQTPAVRAVAARTEPGKKPCRVKCSPGSGMLPWPVPDMDTG